MSEITYIEPPDGPFKVGEYRGKDILMFGAYRVDLGDFVYLSPHSGMPGTVGQWPMPLDDEEFRAALIDAAVRQRAIMSDGNVHNSR